MPLPRRRRRRSWGPFATALLIGAAGAGVWYWWNSATGAAPTTPPASQASRPGLQTASAAAITPATDEEAEAAPAPEAPAPVEAQEISVPAIELQPLDRSDAQVRKLAGKLAGHPLVQRALADSELIWTLVGATLEISEGRTPARRFPKLGPTGAFAVQGDPERPRTAASSHRRYDAMVDAFVGLDSAGAIGLYRQLKPLFDEAYVKLGYPGGDFDDVLGLAFARLLETPEIPADVPLVPTALRYEFADLELESLDPIQRQLLRMGPRNVERALAKVRDLQAVWRASSRPAQPRERE